MPQPKPACPHTHHRNIAVLPMGLADLTGRVPLVEVRACQDCDAAITLTGAYHPTRRTLVEMEAHLVTVEPEGWLRWEAVPLSRHGEVRHGTRKGER